MNHNVKAYRERHNYNQTQMGELLEISKSYISMIENGERYLSSEAQQKFNALVQAETANKIEDFSTVDQSVNKLLNDHASDLRESAKRRIGDLTVLLYNSTKRIKKWKSQTDFAIAGLRYIIGMHAQYTDKEMPAEITHDLIDRRYKAEAIIRNVLRQNPELKAAKIFAINAELDYLQNGKVNLNKQLGFDMNEWMIELPKMLGPSKATE